MRNEPSRLSGCCSQAHHGVAGFERLEEVRAWPVPRDPHSGDSAGATGFGHEEQPSIADS
jgi:hypothetical protein